MPPRRVAFSDSRMEQPGRHTGGGPSQKFAAGERKGAPILKPCKQPFGTRRTSTAPAQTATERQTDKKDGAAPRRALGQAAVIPTSARAVPQLERVDRRHLTSRREELFTSFETWLSCPYKSTLFLQTWLTRTALSRSSSRRQLPCLHAPHGWACSYSPSRALRSPPQWSQGAVVPRTRWCGDSAAVFHSRG